MFDASIIANILDIFNGSLTPPFAIIASHTVSRRVSDRSIALAASCSSDISELIACCGVASLLITEGPSKAELDGSSC